MMKLENFVNMMTGHFDNREQFNMMQKERFILMLNM